MVLTRAFACAVPVVASDIPGYRAVMTDETGVLVPAGRRPARSPTRSSGCSRTSRAGGARRAARGRIAIERYSWDTIAERLEQIYEDVAA